MTSLGDNITRSPVSCRPIEPGDIPALALFLSQTMTGGFSVEQWRNIILAGRSEEADRGRVLLEGDRIVGVYLAIFSEQTLAGRARTVCNLATWCVLPEFRFHSLRLLREMIADEDVVYTDLTPIDKTVAIEARLGFKPFQGSTRLAPCLPWFYTRARATSDPAVIERTLRDSGALRIFRDHRSAPALDHVLLEMGDEQCYVAARRIRRRGVYAHRLLHVSAPETFGRCARAYERHVLTRRRVVAYITDTQIVPYKPLLSRSIESHQRLVRGVDLPCSELDYMYSELVVLPSESAS